MTLASSRCPFLICALLLVYSGTFFYPRWQQTRGEAQLSWDAGGYYWYLPTLFIYKDLKEQNFKDQLLEKYYPTPPDDFQYAYRHAASGNYVIRYTMGTAILEAPFFFIAHALAVPLGYPADGFSLPYQFMTYLGGLTFALIGLWYLRKLLLYYYSDAVTAIVLLLLVFGTNYLNYCGIDVGMSHVWLCSLYVFILLNTHYYYRTLQRKYALRTGALIGLAALIRPPEIIAVLLPLLWGMERISLPALKERLLLYKRQWKDFAMAAVIGMLTLSLQLIYWKYATGNWFVYTYRDQGFSWLHPHLKVYALNIQTGWLIYTPMMLLAILGILPFIKSGRNKIALLSIMLVNYYIVSAWNAWEYGGRAMVQNYPVLMFPLAALVQYIWSRKRLFIIALPLMALFTYFNIWWTYQAHVGGLIGGAPTTWAYFRNTVFRYQVPIEVQQLRDNKDRFTGPVPNPVLLYTNNFDDRPEGNLHIIQEQQHIVAFPASDQKYPWIRATADIHIDQKEWNIWFMTLFTIRFKKGDTVLQTNTIRLQRFLEPGESKNLGIDARVRHTDYDHIEILFHNDNQGKLPCIADNLKVMGFND